MKRKRLWLLIPALFFVLAAVPVFAAGQPAAAPAGTVPKKTQKETAESTGPSLFIRIPLFSERFEDFPVATVDGDPIPLQELTRALAGAHEEHTEKKEAGKAQYSAILNRLVTISLMVHEARNMGLDDLPEVKARVEGYSKNRLCDLVLEKAVRDVKPVDSDVEKIYRDTVREYKIKSMLFTKEEAAKKASEEIKKGKDFDEVVKANVTNKEGVSTDDGTYQRRDQLLPEIAQTVLSMKVGDVSPVTRIEAGYVILKLADMRSPRAEDAEARAQARDLSLKSQQSKASLEFKQGLIKKYVTVHAKIINNLDFEAKSPGFDALLRDSRVVADIKGDKPVTVAELTENVKSKLFHGVQSAVESKTINEKKLTVFDETISKRIFLKEAVAQGLDKTAEYRDAVADYESSVLFDLFIKKAVVPDVKPKPEDLKAYYDAHKKEYSTPRMVKLDHVTFKTEKLARQALARLNKGTDFKWLKGNAEGVTDDAKGFPSPEIPVTVGSLPDALQQSLEGALQGSARLYSSADGLSSIVMVTEVIAEKAQPFDQAVQKIREAVLQEQFRKAFDAWSEKLRENYTVKIYLAEGPQ